MNNIKRIPLAVLMLATTTSTFGDVTITFDQVLGNVFVYAQGSLDLTGLDPFATSTSSFSPAINPSIGLIFLGPGENSDLKNEYAAETYPDSFGSGGMLPAGGGSFEPALGTNMLAIHNFLIAINADYVSGHSLAGGAVFADTTIENMGVASGTYVWTLANGQTITMIVPAVPEPSTYALLLGAGVLGFVFFRRRQQI